MAPGGRTSPIRGDTRRTPIPAVDPDNRLVARGLEAEWELRLRELDQARAELARRQQQGPQTLDPAARHALLCLGTDIERVWSAPTNAPRDRLRTLLEDATIAVHRDEYRAHLTLRRRGGALTELDVDLPRSRPATACSIADLTSPESSTTFR
jgi:hypothetical protein